MITKVLSNSSFSNATQGDQMSLWKNGPKL
jgi:hypothetical protein